MDAFLLHMSTHNAEALQTLFVDDIASTNDNAGRRYAARLPVIGIDKNILFYAKAAPFGGPEKLSVRPINGLPALVGLPAKSPLAGYPKKIVPHLEIDKDGRIVGLHCTLATKKLSGINFRNFRRPEVGELLRANLHT